MFPDRYPEISCFCSFVFFCFFFNSIQGFSQNSADVLNSESEVFSYTDSVDIIINNKLTDCNIRCRWLDSLKNIIDTEPERAVKLVISAINFYENAFKDACDTDCDLKELYMIESDIRGRLGFPCWKKDCAIKFLEQSDTNSLYAQEAKLRLAETYQYCNQHQISLEYLSQIEKFQNDEENHLNKDKLNALKIHTIDNTIQSLINLKEFDSIEKYIDQWNQIKPEELDVNSLVHYYNVYIYICKLHTEKGNYQQAVNSLTEGLELSEKNQVYFYHNISKLKDFPVRAYIQLSDCFSYLNKQDSSLMYAQMAVEAQKLYPDLTLAAIAESNLANKLYEDGQFEQSAKHYRIYKSLNDSLKIIDKMNVISTMRIDVEIQKHQKEIQELNTLNQIQLHEYNNFIKLLFLVLIFVICFFVLLFYLYRLRINNFILKKEKLQLSSKYENSKFEHDEMMLNLSDKIDMLKLIRKEIRIKAEEKGNINNHEFRGLYKKIDENIGTVAELESLQFKLNEVHDKFLKKLINIHPNLSEKEIQLCSLLWSGFSSKQIAKMSFVQERSVFVNRSRLRKKLQLDKIIDLVDHLKGF
jgi:tetratricopeptide (TPR) repeat protein